MRILLVDCYGRSALTVFSALGSGHELVGATLLAPPGDGRVERRLHARRLETVIGLPSPWHEPSAFEAALVAACERHRIDLVLPVESTVLALRLSTLGARLGAAAPSRFGVEAADRLSLLADKWQTALLCRRLGVATPRTELLAGPDDPALRALRCPVVAKPRIAEGARGVTFLHTPAELAAFAAAPPPVLGGFEAEPAWIVQEVVSGTLHDVGACAADGRPVGLVAQRRLVTWEPFGGPGVVTRTTREPELVAIAAELMRALRWNGPILFDFVRDERGAPFLLECNPRLWGTIELAFRAGVNVVEQAVAVFAGGRVALPASARYRVGVTAKWLAPGVLGSGFAEGVQAGLAHVGAIVRPSPGPAFTNLRLEHATHLLGMHVRGRRFLNARHTADSMAGGRRQGGS